MISAAASTTPERTSLKQHMGSQRHYASEISSNEQSNQRHPRKYQLADIQLGEK
jgi:hypothetical protein